MLATKTVAAAVTAGAQTTTINNQLKSSGSHGEENGNGDSNNNNNNNDGNGGGGVSGRQWRWAVVLMEKQMVEKSCRSRKLGGRGEDMAKRQA